MLSAGAAAHRSIDSARPPPPPPGHHGSPDSLEDRKGTVAAPDPKRPRSHPPLSLRSRLHPMYNANMSAPASAHLGDRGFAGVIGGLVDVAALPGYHSAMPTPSVTFAGLPPCHTRAARPDRRARRRPRNALRCGKAESFGRRARRTSRGAHRLRPARRPLRLRHRQRAARPRRRLWRRARGSRGSAGQPRRDHGSRARLARRRRDPGRARG